MKITCVCLLLCFLVVTGSRDRNIKSYKIVCYWSTWSFYRPDNAQFTTENIDPNICTHLIYLNAKLNGNKIAVADHNLDINQEMYNKFNDLRYKNPHLTTMIAIGGWSDGSIKYSQMAKNKHSRKEFVNSVLEFLETHNFDGLDLSWYFPGFLDHGQKGGNLGDKQNFVSLIQELHDTFQPKGYVLSASVSSKKDFIDISYDITALSKHLDFINLMTYDFHGYRESETGPTAPLYLKPSATGTDLEYTVEYAVNYWMNKGADPKKIVMGIPFYGRSWTLAGKDSGYKSKTLGPGTFGNSSDGFLDYIEICLMLKQGGWTVNRDNHFKIPYMVKGNQWISYDDSQSVKDKAEFVKIKQLAGVMVWAIDNDDFKGVCGQNYPLLRTIANEIIRNYAISNYENSKYEYYENQISELTQQIKSISFKYENDIMQMKDALIPNEFIYVQLPNLEKPFSIWPKLSWIEITSQYANIFGAQEVRSKMGIKIWKRIEKPENHKNESSLNEIINQNINLESNLTFNDSQSNNCGVSMDNNMNAKIIGGYETVKGNWPWMVLILDKEHNPWCGGTLITPQFVLTAAHCVRDGKFFIRAGEHDIISVEGSEQEVRVSDIFIYPNYNIKTFDNDIALLKLKSSLKINKFVSLACLPLQNDNLPVNTVGTILGWGKRHALNVLSMNHVLYEANVPVANINQCKKVYNNAIVTSNMICAGYKQGKVDTCKGDSGGPLLVNRNEKWFVYGITSWGEGCAKKYGIYTKVSNYINWIKEKIQNYS